LEKKKIDKCICFVINRQVHGLVIENQCYHVRSLEDAIRYAKELYPNKKRFLMGGSKTFQDAFKKKLIEKIYIVKIDKIYVGDVFFPKEYLESFSKQKEVPSQHFIEITYQEWNHNSFL
jgi:dihydrofolate reductase